MHRLRFSLRAVLILITILSIGFGWIAVRRREAIRRATTIAELSRQGAVISAADSGQPWPGSASLIAQWLGWADVEGVYGIKSDEMLAEAAHLAPLQVVSASGLISNEGLEQLRFMESLESLILNGPSITDEGLSHIEDLLNLRTLDLRATSIGDAGLAHLSRLVNLTSLNLTHTNITNDGLKHLKPLNKLEQLSISGTAVTYGGVARLYADMQGRTAMDRLGNDALTVSTNRKSGQLESLSLKGEQVQDDLLPYLFQEIPDVPKLRLRSTGITADGIASLVCFHNLRRLVVSGIQNGPLTIRDLLNLEELALEDLGDSPMLELRNLPRLRTISLSLAGNDYSGNRLDELTDQLRHLPELHTFNMENVGIRLHALAPLAHLTSLRHLGIDGRAWGSGSYELPKAPIGLASSPLTFLSALPKLETLWLRALNVTDADVAEITQLRELKFLILSGNPGVTDASVELLASLKGLTNLGITQTGISNEGAVQLRRKLTLATFYHSTVAPPR